MAQLLITSQGFENQVINLKLGVTRIGRSAANDFQLEHPTISAFHCEVVLGEGDLMVRDCGSTNGTHVGGKPIKEVRLKAGQTFRLGEIEFLVETTDVTIAIPQFEVSRPQPPVVLSDGSLICPRHPGAQATYQCIHCREVLCDQCVHRLRRRGGKVLKLCPLCSHPCKPLGPEPVKKRSLLGILQKTVKLPMIFTRRNRRK